LKNHFLTIYKNYIFDFFLVNLYKSIFSFELFKNDLIHLIFNVNFLKNENFQFYSDYSRFSKISNNVLVDYFYIFDVNLFETSNIKLNDINLFNTYLVSDFLLFNTYFFNIFIFFEFFNVMDSTMSNLSSLRFVKTMVNRKRRFNFYKLNFDYYFFIKSLNLIDYRFFFFFKEFNNINFNEYILVFLYDCLGYLSYNNFSLVKNTNFLFNFSKQSMLYGYINNLVLDQMVSLWDMYFYLLIESFNVGVNTKIFKKKFLKSKFNLLNNYTLLSFKLRNQLTERESKKINTHVWVDNVNINFLYKNKRYDPNNYIYPVTFF